MLLNGYQERHHDYVIGPKTDGRLASVAPGQVIEKIQFQLDPDAPFQLRSRALWCDYTTNNGVTQDELSFVSSRWTGPSTDYRFQDFVSEAAQMAQFGQFGIPKPVHPIDYPANGTLLIDVANTSTTNTITNLTFLFRGVKRFPPGAVPAYSYPPRFASIAYHYQLSILNLGASELRQNQIFTVKPDADFVLRAGQMTTDAGGVSPIGPNLFFQLMDFNKKPYSNDFVRGDVLFGTGFAGDIYAAGIQANNFIPPFTGPGLPGLFYPEIYIPANHQMIYSVYRNDAALGTPQSPVPPENVLVVLIGAKVFPQ
jgi:hypothetical protein